MRDDDPRDPIPPAPTRDRPMLPAGMELGFLMAAICAAAIFGGGALSGLLTGHGLAVPGWHGAHHILAALVQNPGDPAGAWPGDPRPGPAWLSWVCMIAVGTATALGIATVRDAYDRRRRRRRDHTGMATGVDLRRAGLDSRSAVDKAAAEFPDLARHAKLPASRNLAWWRR